MQGIWASFHSLAEYKNQTANSDENNRSVAVQRQKLDTTIAKNANLSGTAETSFVALQDGVRVVPLDLFRTLRVESVTGEDGTPLAFIQEDKDDDSELCRGPAAWTEERRKLHLQDEVRRERRDQQ